MKKEIIKFLIQLLNPQSKIPIFPLTIIDKEFSYNNKYTHYKYKDYYGNEGFFDDSIGKYEIGQQIKTKE